MANWKCAKCGQVLMNTAAKPLTGTCTKGGNHRWQPYGQQNAYSRWQCGKCGQVISAMTKPLAGSCAKGGTHRWRKA